jgi:hypothetical protein
LTQQGRSHVSAPHVFKSPRCSPQQSKRITITQIVDDHSSEDVSPPRSKRRTDSKCDEVYMLIIIFLCCVLLLFWHLVIWHVSAIYFCLVSFFQVFPPSIGCINLDSEEVTFVFSICALFIVYIYLLHLFFYFLCRIILLCKHFHSLKMIILTSLLGYLRSLLFFRLYVFQTRGM